MRPGEIAGADEEFVHDLAPREKKRLFEQLAPRRVVPRVMFVEKIAERTHGLDSFGVFDRGVHFQPIANDARVSQKPGSVFLAIGCDFCDGEAVIGRPKTFPFFENRQPGQSGLIDLEDEALEQFVVALQGKSILGIVVVLIPLVDSLPHRGTIR